jgi:hypothetical protein
MTTLLFRNTFPMVSQPFFDFMSVTKFDFGVQDQLVPTTPPIPSLCTCAMAPLVSYYLLPSFLVAGSPFVYACYGLYVAHGR